MKKILKVIIVVFGLLLVGTPAWGQMRPEEVSQRMASNFQKLREYSWSTQTEVSLKGQQISITLEKLRYDLNGKLQIIPIGGSGKLRPELQPVVSELAQLGLAYAQPNPQQFSAFFSKAEKWQGTDGTIRIEGQDFLHRGDHLDVRAKNSRADRLSVETVYGNGTPVTIDAEFRALPNDGPTYVARLEVLVPDDGMSILIENFDYIYNAPIAPSDVSIIPAGTGMEIRLTGPLGSKQAKAGQEFQAVLDKDVIVHGAAVLKAGTQVNGQVVSAQGAGRAQGKGKMSIRLTRIQVKGQAVAIETNTLNFEAEGTGKKTGRRLLGGAGVGAAIGAIADGGSGAWKGAAIGAGVGGAATLLTKGNEVEFPKEQLFSFTSSTEIKISG